MWRLMILLNRRRVQRQLAKFRDSIEEDFERRGHNRDFPSIDLDSIAMTAANAVTGWNATVTRQKDHPIDPR
jgi:hypothetical protein